MALRVLLVPLTKVVEGLFIALGAALFLILGFLAVDKVSKVVLNQTLDIQLPAVVVEVELGSELTEILKRIEAKLP